MHKVEISHTTKLYNDGWKVAISMDRWADMQMVSNIYNHWLYERRAIDNMFECHFTISDKAEWLVCFKSEEDMFVAALYFGCVIES